MRCLVLLWGMKMKMKMKMKDVNILVIDKVGYCVMNL